MYETVHFSQVVEETYSLMRDIVKHHKETFDEDNLRDFVDVYLKEMRTSPDISFTEEELLVVSMDMFTAGSETTSTTLAWAVNYMITHPEIQARVQAEIDTVLVDRPPSLEDKEALSYTVATIMEIQVQLVNSQISLELMPVMIRGWLPSPPWLSHTEQCQTLTSGDTRYPR